MNAYELRTWEKKQKWRFLVWYCIVTFLFSAAILIKDLKEFTTALNILCGGLAGTLGALFGFGAYTSGKYGQREIEEEAKQINNKE